MRLNRVSPHRLLTFIVAGARLRMFAAVSTRRARSLTVPTTRICCQTRASGSDKSDPDARDKVVGCSTRGPDPGIAAGLWLLPLLADGRRCMVVVVRKEIGGGEGLNVLAVERAN